MIFEAYLAASMFGPEQRPLDKESKFDEQYLWYYSEERILSEAPNLPEGDTNWFSANVCSYDWVKEEVTSAALSNVEVVICKDIAYAVTGV